MIAGSGRGLGGGVRWLTTSAAVSGSVRMSVVACSSRVEVLAADDQCHCDSKDRSHGCGGRRMITVEVSVLWFYALVLKCPGGTHITLLIYKLTPP